MATVTSQAGTAARRLFSDRYLPNPGSTTTATSFHVEESKLLVMVSLTCLWAHNPREVPSFLARQWHWEISCFKDTLPATGPGLLQGPSYHGLLWGASSFKFKCVCVCAVCVLCVCCECVVLLYACVVCILCVVCLCVCVCVCVHVCACVCACMHV